MGRKLREGKPISFPRNAYPPEPACSCPDGWKHDPLCELVTGRRPAGVTGKETG